MTIQELEKELHNYSLEVIKSSYNVTVYNKNTGQTVLLITFENKIHMDIGELDYLDNKTQRHITELFIDFYFNGLEQHKNNLINELME